MDGGYVVAGWTLSFGNRYQVYLIKTNAFGDTLWTKNYGEANDDVGCSVRQTLDGGYIVAGYTLSFGNNEEVYLVKTTALGDTLWTKTYGGAGFDWGYFVQQTSDTGYIIAGYTSSFGNYNQVYLFKTNASGDTLWTRTYGGATGDDYGYSVQQTSDGGYIVGGIYDYYTPNPQVYLIKTNASGDTLWTRTYGGGNNSGGYSVQQTSDGGYVVAGETNSGTKVYLIKTNASGDTLWTRTYGVAMYDRGLSVQQTTDGGYIVAGYDDYFSYQVYLIKTDTNGNSGVEVSPSNESRVAGFGVFPNPFSSFASVPGHSSERFALYDISGRKVGVYKGDRIDWDVSPGVYFLKPEARGSKLLRVVKVRKDNPQKPASAAMGNHSG